MTKSIALWACISCFFFGGLVFKILSGAHVEPLATAIVFVETPLSVIFLLAQIKK